MANCRQGYSVHEEVGTEITLGLYHRVHRVLALSACLYFAQ
jgi:hypothetical protein